MGKTGSSSGCLAGALLLTSLCGAPAARAQPLPVEPATQGEEPATLHTVTLRGASRGVIWEIYSMEGPIREQTPLARCGDQGCVLRMQTGKYRLWVEGATGEGPHGYRELGVYGDLDLTVRAPPRGAKGGGLTLAILGKVAVFTGMSLTVVGAVGDCTYDDETHEDECESDEQMLNAGLVTMLLGAVSIPVGWVMFARARHPQIEYNEVATTPTNTGRLELGPVRVGSGFGLGSRVTF